MVARSVADILAGDALTWATMPVEQLRAEHEELRRALETARDQISILSPLVAWRHKMEEERDQAQRDYASLYKRYNAAIHERDVLREQLGLQSHEAPVHSEARQKVIDEWLAKHPGPASNGDGGGL